MDHSQHCSALIEWMKNPEWWIVILNLILIYVLIRHLNAFDRQAKSLEISVGDAAEANKETKKSGRQEIRAYVCIQNVQLTWNRNISGKITVTFWAFGKTPAYELKLFARVRFVESEISNFDELPDPIFITEPVEAESFVKRVAVPGVPDHFEFSTTRFQFEGDERTEKSRAVYFYGTILYKDVLGETRRSNFCSFQSLWTGGIGENNNLRASEDWKRDT